VLLVLRMCKFGTLYALICTEKFLDNLMVQRPLVKLSASQVLF